MATPVFACGAECGVVSLSGPHWVGSSGTVSFDTGTVNAGARSFRCNPTTAAAYFQSLTLALSTDWVIRLYVRFATLPSATSSVFRFSNDVGVYFNAGDSKLYVGDSTSNLGATGVSVTTGVWYRVDYKGTATTLDAQVDGVAVGQLSGTFAARVDFYIGSSTATTRDQFTDDILVSQTTTDYPLGGGFVKSYIPNADGTHNVAGANDFEVSLGGVDITNATTDAYTLLDERPLPTTEVDFINGKAPPNATDYVEWEYEDSTEADPPRAVEGIIVHHDAGGAGTNNFTVTLREPAGATSGNVWTGTTNVGTTITAKRAIFLTVPGTSDAWDTTKFNALRSRFLVSDPSPDVYLDAVMLEAEFPEAAGGTAIAFADAPGTSDALGRTGTFARAVSDAATTSDALTRTGTYGRSLADAVTTSSVVTFAVALARSFADAVSTSEALTRTGTFVRSLSDSVTTSDAWTRTGTFVRALADGVTTSDVLAATKIKVMALVDAVTTSDTLTRVLTAGRSLADSVTTSDVLDRTVTAVRSFADAITTSSTLVLDLTGAKVLDFVDAVTSSETFTRTGTYLRALADSLSTADVLDFVKVKVMAFADSVTSSDAWTRAVTLGRSFTDAVTTSDAVGWTSTFVRSFADSVTTSSTLAFARTLLQSFADAITTSSALVLELSGDKVLAFVDAVTSSDFWTRTGGLAPTIRAIASLPRAFVRAINHRPAASAHNPKPRS
jgi:hypothetical protein